MKKIWNYITTQPRRTLIYCVTSMGLFIAMTIRAIIDNDAVLLHKSSVYVAFLVFLSLSIEKSRISAKINKIKMGILENKINKITGQAPALNKLDEIMGINFIEENRNAEHIIMFFEIIYLLLGVCFGLYSKEIVAFFH